MSDERDSTKVSTVNNYEGLFTILASALIVATILLFIGGIYFTFINPSFSNPFWAAYPSQWG